jgi:protein-L-isoaspartate(D-aspartate) O-methyltransferase
MNVSKIARRNMVLCQVTPNKVTDERLISAMLETPRELFVPTALKGVAYIDEDLPISSGRFIMEPTALARLIQLADVSNDDTVLDIGCGSGYSSFILANMADNVTSLEQEEELRALLSQAISATGVKNIRIVQGQHADGHADNGLYNVIFIGGLVDFLPSELANQLKEGGRIITVAKEDGVSRALVLQKTKNGLIKNFDFEVNVKKIPGFGKKTEFAF